MNPIFRWAGSKRQLLHKLRMFCPPDLKRYIEPFCGSACLFFDTEPREAVLGDQNLELITTYRALKHDVGLVCECLRRLPIGESSYYRIRSIAPEALSEPECAARFIYLNRYCFNGIYRTNQRGIFNVPYGPPRSSAGFDYEGIVRAAGALKRATLLSCDFDETLARARTGDFVYLDPPYAVKNRRVFTEYQAKVFAIGDLERLGKSLSRLAEASVTFVVSYADCKEARSILKCWNPIRVRTRRNIAGFVGNRRRAYELMATNAKEVANGI
jgi:DNA adenine methylase